MCSEYRLIVINTRSSQSPVKKIKALLDLQMCPLFNRMCVHLVVCSLLLETTNLAVLLHSLHFGTNYLCKSSLVGATGWVPLGGCERLLHLSAKTHFEAEVFGSVG